jgi:hypothetical protein
MRTLAAIVIILTQSGPAVAQQAAPPPQPRAFTDRATEGACATIFGNVCGACHGKPEIPPVRYQYRYRHNTAYALAHSVRHLDRHKYWHCLTKSRAWLEPPIGECPYRLSIQIISQ